MINSTQLISDLGQLTTESEIVTHLSNKIFLPSIATYWVFQFLITMIIGYTMIKKDKGKFLAIFILTQLIGAIILFFIFIYPIIPQMLDKVF